MLIKNVQLVEWLIKAVDALPFKNCSLIQQQTITPLLQRKNIVGISSTGSGKTLAFLIPALNCLQFNEHLQIVIICPTRELATQIYQQVQYFMQYQKQLRPCLLTNQTIDTIKNKIKHLKPQVLITTPTKLKLVSQENLIDFSYLKTTVIDEADMLLDLDFWSEIEMFFDKVKELNIQKSAWSATLHEQLAIKLKKIFKDTKIIQVGKSIYKNEKIKHHVIHTNDNLKTLNALLKNNNFYLCMIFANTKKEVDMIYNYLLNQKYKVIKLHGDLSKRERAKNYKEIKKLNYQYIVASDLASRGLDIDGASAVISFNLPNTLDWYIHRSGRCGRGKYTGDSYIIYDGKNEKEINKLKAKDISFNYWVQKGNNIIPLKQKPKKEIIDYNLDKSNQAINKLNNKKNNKVKPNYKKKKKQAIDQFKKPKKKKFYYQKSKK